MKKLLACFLSAAELVCVLSGCARMDDGVVTDKPEVTDKVSAMDDEAAKAHAFHDEVIPAMDALRAAADEAESLVDEDYWPLPCYSRMLFYTE